MDIFDYFKKKIQDPTFEKINKLVQNYKLPSCEISQGKDNITVKANLPGMSKKDILLKITHNYLEINAEKSGKKVKKHKGSYKEEKKYMGYRRVVQLPPGLITDNVDAKFQNNKLIVKIPKVKIGKIKIK